MLARSILLFAMLLVSALPRSSVAFGVVSTGLASRGRFASSIRATRLLSSAAGGSDAAFDDYSAKTAFMFPGQGAQYVGMAGEVAASCPAACVVGVGMCHSSRNKKRTQLLLVVVVAF